MLDKFIQAKQEEITRLKTNGIKRHKIFQEDRPCFSDFLLSNSPGAVVAEYKRASPSQGEINLSLTPAEVGNIYKQGGAAAISVLTEKKYFQSELEYLFQFQATGLPILRKDFLFHSLQIEETTCTPASALLLITRVFDATNSLSYCIEHTYELGLEPVVEVFNLPDLDMAREAGARIIQVNNRDLETLQVDADVSRSLIKEKHPEEIWICASGLDSAREKEEMIFLGYDACLIGTSIMANPAPIEKLREFTGKSCKF